MKAQTNHSTLSRRGFLATAASAAALGALGSGCTQEQRAGGRAGRDRIPVGVQVYSVRREAEKDLAGTLAKIAQMGYEGVEFAGYYGHSAKAVRQMLDDNGIVCCGTHTGMDTLSDQNLAATIEYNQILGNKYLIVPWLNPRSDNPREAWLQYAERFNALAEKVRPHGMMVGYHDHAHDHAPLGDTTPWDILFSNTVKDVVMQIDTGNTMSGGADPLSYLRKYPGRAITVHLKEYSATNKNAMIGEGDVNWAEFLRLTRTIGGTRWYIIEEEKDIVPPLEGIEISLRNFERLRA